MRDVGKPDGRQMFRYRILQGLHADQQNLKVVAIPITSVIKYDIENLKIEMNEQYDFMEDLEKQLKNAAGGAEHAGINLDKLGQFGAALTADASHQMHVLKSPGDRQRLDAFLKQLYKLYQIKHQAEK